MKLELLAEYLWNRLQMDAFVASDDSMNGLQVGRTGKEVQKVVCAVDASLATFYEAAKLGADALFVHHGLFWGKSFPLTKANYERIAVLVNYDMALLAAHLPLDAHPKLGNNSTIARLLDVEQQQPFGLYHGQYIGSRGTLTMPLTIEQITERLGLSLQTGLRVLSFGKKIISTVGIVSGGAAHEVQEAIELGLDAYITGEASHTMYAACQESHMTMICGGHYATEVFGVQQVARDIQEQLGIETSFIALPTAL